MKTKRKHYVLIILGVTILVIAIVILSNPLRKSEAGIRKDMLDATPIGTDMEKTIKVVKSNKEWETEWIAYDHGYGTGLNGVPGEAYATEVGEKSMRIYAGNYSRFVFPVHVVVYYGFDKDSKLVDIAVRKDTDMP